MGIMIMPIHMTILFMAFIISDCSLSSAAFASRARREIYDSFPTLSSLATHSPEVTKLPESSLSPGVLGISSCSPVSSASLTEAEPSRTIASAQI